MWGCGGGGFGLGLLGGAMLASSMAPAYYSAPVVVQQPPVVIQTDQSTNSNQPHSHVHAMHPMYPQSTHPHPHAYIPPPPPTYEERQRLYASGYGPDPDVVFYLFERLDTNSLCGIPGPWCSLGRAIQLFSPRSIPAELSDIYTVDEWITLRRSIESINSKYQWHPCPLFCLYLCCVPSCLQSTKEYDLSLLLNHETHRLKPQGLFWHIPEETDSVDFTTKGLDLRLLACLKVDVLMRNQFEMDHPTRRRIAKQLYGNIVMPIAPSNVIDTARSSLFKPVAIHGEVGHSLEPSS